jgi:6-phosphofructokinase 1
MSVAAPLRAAPATLESPWRSHQFVADDATIAASDGHVFEMAGARARLAFGADARCGVLTAGGLSPGLNDVIRGVTLTLWHGYGVREILGIEHGYEGLADPAGQRVRPLTPEVVRDIHRDGGTILGTARGRQDLQLAARRVAKLRLSALLCVGGDGTLKGARAIDAALREAGHACAVVGIPKTIDNDVPHCSRTFGHVSAVEEAARAIAGAHAEAHSHRDGVAVVQLMGRESGFIAASATLACPDVNFCLVPEVPFAVEGEHGLAAAVASRLADRGHAVIVVAEGAGEKLWSEEQRRVDASGNVKLPPIGPHLAREIEKHLRAVGRTPTIKLIDPSYLIRSGVAGAVDRILCLELAQAAVHAAVSGRTALMIGEIGDDLAHVPLEIACSGRKRLDPLGATWQAVLASTGQPPLAPPS